MSDTTQLTTQSDFQADNIDTIQGWSGTEMKILNLLLENPNILQRGIAEILKIDIGE